MSNLLSNSKAVLRTHSLTVSDAFSNQVRHYAIPGGSKSVLTKRVQRKLTPGKTRPAIYYKFDCRVELSDGSTFVRRSQYPRVEWRYLADQRNNIVWNPSRTNLKAIEADATGRLAKFKQKYGFFDGADSGDRTEALAADSQAEETKVAATEEQASKPSESKSRASLMEDYLELMEKDFIPVQSGGKVAGKRRGKK